MAGEAFGALPPWCDGEPVAVLVARPRVAVSQPGSGVSRWARWLRGPAGGR